MTTGKIYLLPVGHPMLPPREQDMDLWCDARIEVTDLPMMQHEPDTVAYRCTRRPHSGSEVHASEPASGDLHPAIVWGGE